MTRKQGKQLNPIDLMVQWKDGQGQTWNVEFELKTVKNVARINGFSIQATSPQARLTANHLREIPFGDLSEQFLALARRTLPKSKRETLPGSPGLGRTSSPAQLTRVAELYVQASQKQVDVQFSIAEALGVSSATAARRIRAARKSGLLPPRKPRG
jgi:hypothetical protein